MFLKLLELFFILFFRLYNVEQFINMDQPRSSQSHRTVQGEVNSISRTEETSASPSGNTVLFREIHKNAWLKRLPLPDKKFTGAVPKVISYVYVQGRELSYSPYHFIKNFKNMLH